VHRDDPDHDAELRALTDSGGPGELAVELQRVLELAVRAIPTCIGVSLVLLGAVPAVTLSVLRPGWTDQPVLASMSVRIPRPVAQPESDDRAELLVFAAARHAFRDAAPSLLALLDMTSRQLTLDAHLQLPDLAAERARLLRWLDEQGVIDRAVGILLGRGLLPSEGRLELARLAAVGGTSVFAAARALIASTTYGLDK
jgi:hypothetical protein